MRALFPDPSPAQTTWRSASGLALAIAAGAGINLLRSRGPGAINTVWIEDAQNFLNDALIVSFRGNLFKSLNGYYHIGPRVLAEIASVLPIGWAAPALSLMAALVTAGFGAIVYMASKPLLPQWWLRLFISAPVVLLPLARTQADSDVATLHFPGLYALFWILLWRPASRTGKIVAVLATAFIAFSSIIPLVFVPLVLLRWWYVRDWAVPLTYAAGMGLHLLGLALGKATRSNVCCPRYDPMWTVEEYVTKVVPRSIFGEKWLGGPGVDGAGWVVPVTGSFTGLIVAAWVVVLAVIVCAATGLTRPHWQLAILAGGYSVVAFAIQISNMGVVQPRYVIVPALLLYTCMAALLRPGAVWPARLLIAVLAVGVVVNFRVDNARTTSTPWQEIIRTASEHCTATGQNYVHRDEHWWRITIPCDRVQ